MLQTDITARRMTGKGDSGMEGDERGYGEPEIEDDGPVYPLVSLRWSLELPTESGWYWMRSAPMPDPEAVDDAEIVLIRGDTLTCPMRVLSIDGGKVRLDMYADRERWIEWAGPLSPPAN